MEKLESKKIVLLRRFLEKRGIKPSFSDVYELCSANALFSEFIVDAVINGDDDCVNIKEFQSSLRGIGFKTVGGKVCFALDGTLGDVFKYTPEFKGCRDTEEDIKTREDLRVVCEAILLINRIDDGAVKTLRKIRSKFVHQLTRRANQVSQRIIGDDRVIFNSNIVGRFLADKGYCIGGSTKVISSSLYSEYVEWCGYNEPMTQHFFGSTLMRMGAKRHRYAYGRVYFL